jgi:P pilus assembly chaperone PapD
MRSVAAAKRFICSVAFLSAVGWANQAYAQLGVGTTWVRTDAQGKGVTMTVESIFQGGGNNLKTIETWVRK